MRTVIQRLGSDRRADLNLEIMGDPKAARQRIAEFREAEAKAIAAEKKADEAEKRALAAQERASQTLRSIELKEAEVKRAQDEAQRKFVLETIDTQKRLDAQAAHQNEQGERLNALAIKLNEQKAAQDAAVAEIEAERLRVNKLKAETEILSGKVDAAYQRLALAGFKLT